MGYSTDYELEIVSPTKDEIIAELNNTARKDGYDDLFCDDGTAETMKWYEHEAHMRVLSLKFPTILFVLSGKGECPEDIWKKYFKAGKMQEAKAEITLAEFDEAKLV